MSRDLDHADRLGAAVTRRRFEGPGSGGARPDLVWLDWVKAIALAWIFLNHVVERVFGFPYIANPFPGWPPLSERVAQLAPLSGYGVWSVPVNLARYLGWSGDQGVQLFLIVSGFGLTWGLLGRYGAARFPLAGFYRRRAARIYPLWWGVHAVFAATWLVAGVGMAFTDPALYLSMLGIRVTPGLLYYFAPAWWYIGLLIQLYLVYPLLWAGLHRLGPGRLLVLSCVVGFALRAAGLALFDGYLDAWQRGAVFVTRLPEFVLGMSLAAYLHRAPEATERWLRSPGATLLAVGAYVIGTVLSLTLLGMTVAPFLLGAGALIVLYPLLVSRAARSPAARPVIWAGRHSYSLYLVHHPVIMFLVPMGLASQRRALAGSALAVALTLIGGIALERGVDIVQAAAGRVRRRAGTMGLVLRVGTLAGVLVLVLLSAELVVRRLAPQEVRGWGERVSLTPDPRFGWHLKPSSETRLRWESYDYRVTANSLGFPGPEYPVTASPGTLRILTTGDAFTSAEGVDTGLAWPRKLEGALRTRLAGRSVEVLNFAITGYGPNQYAAVVETFAPRYRPQVILIEMYPNDYQDVLLGDDEFRRAIGFELAPQDDWKGLATAEHLRSFVRWRVLEPAKARLRGQPDPRGYFLAGFGTLERRPAEERNEARRQVTARLSQIGRVASDISARVVIVLVPAAAQVCGPADLRYHPDRVSLHDTTRFDPDGPRWTTEAIARSLGFDFIDLLPVLKAGSAQCPYQPGNMHWLPSGHELVARHLAGILVASGHLAAP